MAEENENTEEKKSSKKLFLIIGVVVLLLTGGGGAYFFMGGEEPPADGEQAEQQAEEAEAEEEASEEEGVKKELAYYDLGQPLRVNFPKGSRASLIEIKLAFLSDDPEAEAMLEKHKPMIVNNLLMAISAAGSDKLATAEGKTELQKGILDEVNKVMKKMTGKERVKNVFFTRFVMQ